MRWHGFSLFQSVIHSGSGRLFKSESVPPMQIGCGARGCSETCSRPAVAHALNDDVVNDRAHARGGFGSELGRFLLLDRMDKAPQIDGPVLNGDRQHGRPPWLRSHPRRDLFTQLEVIYARKRFLVALANACKMFARLTMPTSLPP